MKNCPCGTGRPYCECCEPYITGKAKAPTAEALMRSRYSAYVEHEIDYIINTCVIRDKDKDIDYKSTRDWSEQSKWLGLKIISTEKGGIADNEGTVEFKAEYERNGLKDVHHETAKFKRKSAAADNATESGTVAENTTETAATASAGTGEWLYDEGDVVPHTVVRSSPKVGRNEPCPCGSGKKFKHCCGK